MTLTHRKKLKIFHDTFIEYCLEEIVRNRKISDGIDVPHLSTSLENSLNFISRVPILRETSDFIVLLDNLRRTYNERSDASEIVNNLFPLHQISHIKQILSAAILDVAIEMEYSLDEGKVPQDISKLAALTMLKMFGIIKSGSLEVDQLNKQYIVEAVSKKQGWLESIFLSQTPNVKESRNYKFISAIDLKDYLSSKDDGISLSSFIRQRYKLYEDIQIVIQDEIPEDIIVTGIDISYKGLNGYEFDSEIFRIDRVESTILTYENELAELERKLTKYKAAIEEQKSILDYYSEQIAKHEDRLNIHESLIQQALTSSRTEEENPISLSERLKHLYALQDVIPNLIEDESVPEQKMEDYYVNLQILLGDKISGDKLPITVETIFDRIKDSPIEAEKILVLGGAGIGKTTLLNNFAYRWGKEGLFSQFKYVFKLRLKLLLTDWREEYSYAGEDLINNPLKYFIHYSIMQDIHLFSEREDLAITVSEVASVIQSHLGEALFLFTGYDEIAQLTTMAGIVKNIVASIFKLKYIILDSRKNALTSHYEKRFDRYIENEGFNHDGTREYVEKYFNKLKEELSDSIAKDKVEIRKQRLLDLLEKNSNVRELAATPLNIALLCLISSDEHQAIDRFTHNFNLGMLYKEVIIWLGKRYITKIDPTKVIDVNTDPQALLDSEMFKSSEVFKALKTIAYDGFINNKLVLEGRFIASRATASRLNIVNVNKFGLLRVDNVGKAKDPNDLLNRNHAFIHLSFQEYLTAHYLVDQLLLPVDDPRSRNAAEFIANHRNEPRYLNILKFAAGLIANQEDELAVRKFWEAILCNINGIIETGIDNKVTLLMHLLEQSKIDGELDSRIPYLEKIKELIDVVVGIDVTKFHDHIIQSGYASPKIMEAILAILEFNNQWKIKYAGEVIRAQGEFVSIAVFYLKIVVKSPDQRENTRDLAKGILASNNILFIAEDIESQKDRITPAQNIELQTAIKIALELTKTNHITAQELMDKILIILHYPNWQVKSVAIKVIKQLIKSKSDLIGFNIEFAKIIIDLVQWYITDENLKHDVIGLLKDLVQMKEHEELGMIIKTIILKQVLIFNEPYTIKNFTDEIISTLQFKYINLEIINEYIEQLQYSNWLQRYIYIIFVQEVLESRPEFINTEIIQVLIDNTRDCDDIVRLELTTIWDLISRLRPEFINAEMAQTLLGNPRVDSHSLNSHVVELSPELINRQIIINLIDELECKETEFRSFNRETPKYISSAETLYAAVKSNPEFFNEDIVQKLEIRLKYNDDESVKTKIVELLHLLFESKPYLINTQIVECLVLQLWDKGHFLGISARNALIYIAKINPELINLINLTINLKDSHSTVCSTSAKVFEVVAKFRSDLINPEIVKGLIFQLRSRYSYVRLPAIEALNSIANTRIDLINEKVVAVIIVRLNDDESNIRAATSKTLSTIDISNSNLINIENIIEKSSIYDHPVKLSVVQALYSITKVKPKLINTEMLKALIENLRDDNRKVRSVSVEAIRLVVTSKPELLFVGIAEDLVNILSNDDAFRDHEKIGEILEYIMALRAEFINSTIVESLMSNLSNINWKVREVAIRALNSIAKLNPKLLSINVLETLKSSLRDDHKFVIIAATEALSSIAITLSASEYIKSKIGESLLKKLKDTDYHVRLAAAQALALISIPKKDEMISRQYLENIISKLNHSDFYISVKAAEALNFIARFKAELFNIEIVESLIQNLSNRYISLEIAKALFLIVKAEPKLINTRTVESLINSFSVYQSKEIISKILVSIINLRSELINDQIVGILIIQLGGGNRDAKSEISKVLALIIESKPELFNDEMIENIMTLLNDSDRYVKPALAKSKPELFDIKKLITKLDDGERDVRLATAEILYSILELNPKLVNAKIVNQLIKNIINDRDIDVRLMAVKILSSIDISKPELIDSAMVFSLVTKLKDTIYLVSEVILVMTYFFLPVALKLLDHPHNEGRTFVIQILITILSNEEERLKVKIESLLSIIAFYDENDNEKKHLIVLAKKALYLKLDNLSKENIIWITDNYDNLLKLSYETPLFLQKVYHKILSAAEQITDVEKTFIVKTIEHGVATSITNKDSIIFEGKVYKIGSSSKLCLAEIRAAILAQEDDILVRQSIEYKPIFPNTGIGLRIANYDNSNLTRYEKQALFYRRIDSLQELLAKYLGLEKFNGINSSEDSRSLMTTDDATQRSTTVTLFSEPSHRLHNANILELIRMINACEIGSDTVICLERKQYGNNLGIRDVVFLADILQYSEIALPKSLISSPIYYDAILYNIAKDKDILVVGIEGKGLEHSKNSPYYHIAREEYMANKLYEISSFGRNSIFLAGGAHINNLIKLLGTQGFIVDYIKQNLITLKSNQAVSNRFFVMLDDVKVANKQLAIDSYSSGEYSNSQYRESHFDAKANQQYRFFSYIHEDTIYKFNPIWEFKKWLYPKDIVKFYQIMQKYNIVRSIDELKDTDPSSYSFYAEIENKELENDVLFVASLKEKLNLPIGTKEIEYLQPFVYKANMGIKITDTLVDIARLVYTPSVNNAQKTLMDVAHIYSIYAGINGYSALITSCNLIYKVYEGEYTQAISQAATSMGYMLLPTMVASFGVPYIGFGYTIGLTIFTGYHTVLNALSFYYEVNQKDSMLNSNIAYQAFAETLSTSYIQSFYDFTLKAKEYEKTVYTMKLEEKGEFGNKLYEYIYSRIIDEKYDLHNASKAKHIKVMEYDHCMEIIMLKEEEVEHYYCYNEEQEILDHILIGENGRYIEILERL